MSWKKHFTRYYGASRQQGLSMMADDGPTVSQDKWANFLGEVFEGAPDRIERYVQYNQMDLDSEINAALNIIAEFSTQMVDGEPFRIDWIGKNPGKTETDTVNALLTQWMELNEFDRRLWRLFRSTLKFGDQFLIRDPQTWKLYWVNPKNVLKIGVDRIGREITSYLIKNIDINFPELTATDARKDRSYGAGYGNSLNFGSTPGSAFGGDTGAGGSLTGLNAGDESAGRIRAEHVIHMSLTEGMTQDWPFGESILEPVYKTYKQKEMIEDAILIYRIQRAPERRVFYIQTGDMPPAKARAYMERVKNEMHQKRIPNRQGGTHNITDATYNPQSINEDLYFTVSGDGQGSRVDVLPGGQNLGEINDLQFFSLKLLRGLGIPGSYLPSGPEEGSNNVAVADGKMNAAFVQELRFSNYCERLQNLIAPTFEDEFKRFCQASRAKIETSSFRLKFQEPMNFAKYRQLELEGAMVSAYSPLFGIPLISQRMIFKKYMNWDDADIYENERLLAEEQRDNLNIQSPEDEEGKANLANVGIEGGGGFGMDGPDGGGPPDMGGEMGGDDLGGPAGPDGGGGGSPIDGTEGGGPPPLG